MESALNFVQSKLTLVENEVNCHQPKLTAVEDEVHCFSPQITLVEVEHNCSPFGSNLVQPNHNLPGTELNYSPSCFSLAEVELYCLRAESNQAPVESNCFQPEHNDFDFDHGMLDFFKPQSKVMEYVEKGIVAYENKVKETQLLKLRKLAKSLGVNIDESIAVH